MWFECVFAGVCLQHDILYEELTVKEHLLLFARIKGVAENREEAEVGGEEYWCRRKRPQGRGERAVSVQIKWTYWLGMSMRPVLGVCVLFFLDLVGIVVTLEQKNVFSILTGYNAMMCSSLILAP